MYSSVAFTDWALNGSPLWNFTPWRSVSSQVVSLTIFQAVASIGLGLRVLASRSSRRSYMCSSWVFVVQSTIVTASIVRGSAAIPTTISLRARRSCASAGTATTRTETSIIRARIAISLHAELGIERVPEPVAQQVDAERGQGQRGAREGGEPPGDVEEVAALGQHAAPRRCRRLHAEAQEADRGLGHHELRELKAGHHHDRGRDVGEHVTEQEPGAPGAQCGRGLDEVALLHRKHFAAHHASIHDPAGGREADDDVA